MVITYGLLCIYNGLYSFNSLAGISGSDRRFGFLQLLNNLGPIRLCFQSLADVSFNPL